MARYDYGLRGPSDHPIRGYSALRPYAGDVERRGRARRPPRIVEAYDRDYVDNRGYPRRNHHPDAAERRDEHESMDAYHPYLSRGRGSTPPYQYDHPFYDPDYGGRYPDEL